MPLNSYFLQGSQGEQRLVQDLINEQLKIFGQDIIYLPRKMVSQDAILNEAIASEFDDSFRMEAYLANYEGFAGNGDILSKFGVQSTDQITLIISRKDMRTLPVHSCKEKMFWYHQDHRKET